MVPDQTDVSSEVAHPLASEVKGAALRGPTGRAPAAGRGGGKVREAAQGIAALVITEPWVGPGPHLEELQLGRRDADERS